MKYVPFLALLVFTAACGSSEPAPDRSSRSPEPAEPRDSGRAEIRAKINAKKQELAQADGDLSKIAAEREQLAGQPASESKTNRLVELARLESDAKLRKTAITEDIADLQSQLAGPSSTAAAKPASADNALDDILAGNDSKEKEEAERRRQKAEAEAAADKERIAKAEAARNAEMEERSKQKIEGGRLAAGPDGPAYEERWADVINKVRAELQKYKRW